MPIVAILILSVSVAIDAFAVSVGGALCDRSGRRVRNACNAALFFGGFQIVMGYNPQVCHMNEGHAGFLSLARISHLVNDFGYEPDVALEVVWRSNIFTTHTPVPAGNEVFDIGMILSAG